MVAQQVTVVASQSWPLRCLDVVRPLNSTVANNDSWCFPRALMIQLGEDGITGMGFVPCRRSNYKACFCFSFASGFQIRPSGSEAGLKCGKQGLNSFAISLVFIFI
ncbi:hypothetical protein ILYODFUR_023860 [Ilyodon furcidens]|uniref:Uncharacterized protein n=1 Tax=Ilyodon furcidens TaxID=33524 RepID=A0ABV0UJ57_9TELE